MKLKLGLISILIIAFCLSTFAQTNRIATSKRAIICLTYDDGLETHLSTVIPQLDSMGLKATFFLNSIQGSSQSAVIGQAPEAVLGKHSRLGSIDKGKLADLIILNGDPTQDIQNLHFIDAVIVNGNLINVPLLTRI